MAELTTKNAASSRMQSRRYAVVTDYPKPGTQDCYRDNPEAGGDVTFIASGTVPAGTVVTNVRVRINGLVYQSEPPITTAVASQPSKWKAVFPLITKDNGNLTPNIQCSLLVEASDQEHNGFRFRHVPTAPEPAELKLTKAVPQQNHTMKVEGKTTNIDINKLEITTTNGSITNLTRTQASATEGEGIFSFTLEAVTGTSAANQPEVKFKAKNTTGDDEEEYCFRLHLDYEPPVFEPESPEVNVTDDAVTITGVVKDLNTITPTYGGSPASGFKDDDSKLTHVIGGPEAVELAKTLTPKSSTEFSFELKTVPKPTTPGSYFVAITATDISGNNETKLVTFTISE